MSLLITVDTQDEALGIAQSLDCVDVLLDARKINKEEAVNIIAFKLPTHISEDQGCAATIVLPEVQAAFDYACKITQKHGTVMTVSVVPSLQKATDNSLRIIGKSIPEISFSRIFPLRVIVLETSIMQDHCIAVPRMRKK